MFTKINKFHFYILFLFVINSSFIPVINKTSYEPIYLYQKQTVGTTDYYIYIPYYPSFGTVGQAEVYLDVNCTQCYWYDQGNSSATYNGGISWTLNDTILLNTSCGDFYLSGNFVQQTPCD